MRTGPRVVHRFVEPIPGEIEEGTVYVSLEFATAIHLCACGCGTEVVTPLSPTDWKLIFDGESISLDPSIGNWSMPCRSHYWIRRGRVHWAPQWSEDQIEAGRKADRARKADYFEEGDVSDEDTDHAAVGAFTRLWHFVRSWLR
jgi:hypothetical protein